MLGEGGRGISVKAYNGNRGEFMGGYGKEGRGVEGGARGWKWITGKISWPNSAAHIVSSAPRRRWIKSADPNTWKYFIVAHLRFGGRR